MGKAPSAAARPAAALSLDDRTLTRRTGLTLPTRFSLHDWKRLGRQLFLISDSSCWWLGDWLVHGQDRYPDRYRQAVEETGLDYKTLRNYAWVTRRYPAAARHAGLSFQHHAEVASLPAVERDAWLIRAERENWSRNMLRRQLRAELAGASRADRPRKEVRLQLLTTSDRENAWATAAQRAGRDLADWIIHSLDQAADGEEQHRDTG